VICLPAFRHITQILLDLRQQTCVEFRQSDENLDVASDAQELCGIALRRRLTKASPHLRKHIRIRGHIHHQLSADPANCDQPGVQQPCAMFWHCRKKFEKPLAFLQIVWYNKVY
ncbi:MAG: hypothetical protein IKO27_02305, partial [Ruminococcus sp.]|nr:hypothetical protein [Ruminococcus sp.]